MDKKKIKKHAEIETAKITIKDITKEEFEISKEVDIYHHPKIGTAITKTATRKLCPDGYYIFRASAGQHLAENVSVHLNQEEAVKLNVPVTGNPKLGVRLYNESACQTLAASMSEERQKDFLKMTFCLFHREELEEYFNPKPVKESVVTPSNVSVDSDIKDLLIQNTVLLKQQNEYQKQTAESLNRIADLMERFLDKKVSVEIPNLEDMKSFLTGCSELKEIPDLKNIKEEASTDSMELDPASEPFGALSDMFEKETEDPYQKIRKQKESGNPIVLQLKREPKKGLVYKKNPDEIDIYKKQILEGVPQSMHNHVLSRAYTRMRDVYGVPLDTYKNEYFADTGKLAKSTLEIAHWLEFRNPVIKGLLHCCIETVFGAE